MISVITFVLMHAVPGGPFTQDKRLPPAILEQLNAKYKLDAPLYVQYPAFVRDIALPVVTTGEQSAYLDHEYLITIPLPFGDRARLRWMNFGPSYRNVGRTVSDIFRDNLPVSMQLGALAFLVAVIIGVPLGIISALRRNTLADYAAMAIAVFGVSVPVIVLAPMLQYLLGVDLKWLPVSGWGTFRHAILPAFALGIAESALVARLTRASGSAMQGKGLNQRKIANRPLRAYFAPTSRPLNVCQPSSTRPNAALYWHHSSEFANHKLTIPRSHISEGHVALVQHPARSLGMIACCLAVPSPTPIFLFESFVDSAKIVVT